MRLVKNEEKYWEFIRNLRNDPEVKRGFINQTHISKEDQEIYMDLHPDSYYVLLDDNRPVGYIGEVDDDIRLAVSKNEQRRGYARKMLDIFMKLHPRAKAKVLHRNTPSLRLFESCGFVQYTFDNKFNYYRYDVQVDKA